MVALLSFQPRCGWIFFYSLISYPSTSFSLTDEQVDKLVAASRELLRNKPDFQRFLAGLRGKRTVHR